MSREESWRGARHIWGLCGCSKVCSNVEYWGPAGLESILVYNDGRQIHKRNRTKSPWSLVFQDYILDLVHQRYERIKCEIDLLSYVAQRDKGHENTVGCSAARKYTCGNERIADDKDVENSPLINCSKYQIL